MLGPMSAQRPFALSGSCISSGTRTRRTWKRPVARMSRVSSPVEAVAFSVQIRRGEAKRSAVSVSRSEGLSSTSAMSSFHISVRSSDEPPLG